MKSSSSRSADYLPKNFSRGALSLWRPSSLKVVVFTQNCVAQRQFSSVPNTCLANEEG